MMLEAAVGIICGGQMRSLRRLSFNAFVKKAVESVCKIQLSLCSSEDELLTRKLVSLKLRCLIDLYVQVSDSSTF